MTFVSTIEYDENGLAARLVYRWYRNEPDLSVKSLCPNCLRDTKWAYLGIGKPGYCRCGPFDAAVADRSPLMILERDAAKDTT